MRRFGRKAAVSGAMTLGALAFGVALAAWTANGTGSGYAGAVSAEALETIDVSASTTADLYPGATGDVLLRISNPNPYPVQVTSVTGSGSVASDKGAACDASTGVSFADQTGLELDVAAGSAETFTLSGAASMSNASANACQGALFTIPVSIAGQSNA